MKRGYALTVNFALLLGLVFTVTFSLKPSPVQEKLTPARLDKRQRFLDQNKDNFYLQHALAAGNPSSIGGNRSWMLHPEVFDYLSSGGKRAALYVSGLMEAPQERYAPQIPQRAIAPLATSPGYNLRVNNPSLDRFGVTQSETTVASTGNNIVVSFNDTGAINLIFLDINLSGYAVSTNGGITFAQRRVPTPRSGFNLGDGVVDTGPNGEFYYSMLSLIIDGRVLVGVSKSTDGGSTFSEPVNASTTASSTVDFLDKEWLTVDKGANSPFRGNVYVTWTQVPATGEAQFIQCARSTNGGATWGPPVRISTPGILTQASMPIVAPNGEIYVVYEHLRRGEIAFAKSTDGGLTFSTPKIAARFNSISFTSVNGGNGVRVFSFPYIATDQKGNIHLVFAATSKLFTPDHADIFYVRSTDGGNTFSQERKVNDDDTLTTQLNPSVAVTADGTVGIKWWDRRNDVVNDSLTDVYMAFSSDGGTNFSKNYRVTDGNWFFAQKDPFVGQTYHGDYDGMGVDGNNFLLTWSDERGGDPDVYYTQIPSNQKIGAPDFNISATKLFDSVVAGESLEFEFKTTGFNGYSKKLNMEAFLPPINGLNFSFDSEAVTTGDSTKMRISTSSFSRPGTYIITIAATDSEKTRTTNVRFTIFKPDVPTGMVANASKTPGLSIVNSGLQIDAEGTAHLVYDDDTAVAGGKIGSEVFYRRSTDGGRTYSNPIKLSAGSQNSFDSALALDKSGNLNVVWTTVNAARTAATLFHSRSTDGGVTFSPPKLIPTPDHNGVAPNLVVDKDGNILIGYLGLVIPEPQHYFVVRSTDGGATFSTPAKISIDGENVQIGQVAFDSQGGAYVVYHALTRGAGDQRLSIVAFATAPDGQNFSASRNISGSLLKSASLPTVAVDNKDNVYVAFCNGLEPGLEIGVIKSTDRGQTFGKLVGVSQNRGNSRLPFMLTDSKGAINIVWDDSTPDRVNPDILFSRSTNGGLSFSQPVNISVNPTVSVRPCAAVDGNDNLLVAWNDDSPANNDVLVASVIVSKLAVTVPVPPRITGIEPVHALIGSEITILGSLFQGATEVIFSDNLVLPPSEFDVAEDGKSIKVKVPQGAKTGAVLVRTQFGTATSPEIFIVDALDYLLTVNPESQTIVAGASTSFTIGIESSGPLGQPVILSVSSADSTITTNFSDNNLIVGGRSTLTVNTLPTTPSNFVYNLVITGNSGGIVKTRNVTLNVTAPDFGLSFSPAQVNINRGQAGTFTVNINRTGGFSGNVTVTAPDTKALKIKLTQPVQTTTGASVTFNYKVKNRALTGQQQLIFSGKDDSGRIRTATLTLVIQ
jgi:hypothetical protein